MGFLALHGGFLEKTTDVIAREAAEHAGASYYGVWHPDGPKHHLPSTAYDPAESDALRSLLDHVQVVIAVHGYGREELFHSLLVGGQNRGFAAIVTDHLRDALPEPYEILSELDAIPKGLRGQHVANPVNLPPDQGVQVELPPTVRWNRDEHNWSEFDGVGRAPHIDSVIDALARSAAAYGESR